VSIAELHGGSHIPEGSSNASVAGVAAGGQCGYMWRLQPCPTASVALLGDAGVQKLQLFVSGW